MSPCYLKENTLKVWQPAFEPFMDPTQWPPYSGFEFWPDPTLLKGERGRRKKKRFRGVMDNAQGQGQGGEPVQEDDRYGFGDFDAAPTEIRCSKCHKVGHNINKHKKKQKQPKPKKRKVRQV